MTIKGVLFDLDGVITDTAQYHYIAWKNCASNLGIEIDKEFNEKLKGIDRVNSLKIILNHGSLDLNEEEFEQALYLKNNEYIEAINLLTSKDILPGIKSFLIQLRANGIRTAICSASKNANIIIEKLGIGEFFDAIIDPSKLAEGKPAPDIFIEGAKSLGFETFECIGIEDSISGIQSIKSANMCAVGIGSVELKEAGADILYKDTTYLDLYELEERLSII